MAPARPLKRQKTNPTASGPPPPASLEQAAKVPLPPDKPEDRLTTRGPASSEKSNQSSWINRTWGRKAPPLTAVVNETVPAASSTAHETRSVVKDQARGPPSPSLAMTLGKTQTNRSLPIDATTTMVHATPETAISPTKKKTKGISSAPQEEAGKNLSTVEAQQVVNKEADTTTNSTEVGQSSVTNSEQLQSTQSTWLGWWPKREAAAPKPGSEATPPQSVGTPQDTAKPDEPSPAGAHRPPEGVPPPPEQIPSTRTKRSHPPQAPAKTISNKRSWYQMWNSETANGPTKPGWKSTESSARDTAPAATSEVARGNAKAPANLDIPPPKTPQPRSTSQASSLETSAPPPLPGDSSKSSGWVFWSRDRKAPTSSKESEPHVGEIAISDTPSQSHPKRASFNLDTEAAKPPLKATTADGRPRPGTAQKPGGYKATGIQEGHKQKPQHTKTASLKKETAAESSDATPVSRDPVEVSATPRTASPAPSKKDGLNLLLPALKDTLNAEEHSSILQQLARLLYYTKEPELKHLSVVKDPPRIKNALAIGVHGYFPAPLIRTVLGHPTGTSIKFADMAAKNIKAWTNQRGYDCHVKTAALEGEGRIAERIELLWKLLLNWIDEIRRSDFLLIACHSQGVPVAIMLVAKLIQFGCINSARVGICAMAGVNMGPFVEYKSRWISGSAGELFEFSDPHSKVSTDYLAAIEVVLKFGVRLTFIGSIDDQLVSMESSIYAPITHPHIYRAVLVDSRIHAPNFLSHLVGFALKLRNVGVPDHGLIKELSSPLAGSLYTGEGHSRIYEDDAVYELAITFALETTTLKDVPLTLRPSNSGAGNPYILPFAMRGILEEDYVKSDLQHEARELLEQFDQWKPTTKVLKDVKFRLEGIRSKL